MKKSLIAAIGLSVLLFSCKKTTQTTVTEPTETGTAQLSGNISIAQASGANAPAVGVTVSVSIPNNKLYPQSLAAQGSTVSSGKTDINGNYSFGVTTNSGVGGAGIVAPIVVGNLYGTFDPINGTSGIFSGTTSANFTFISGIPVTYNTNLNSFTATGSNVIGTATVLGKVFVDYWNEAPAGVYGLKDFPLANQTVQINFNRDPTTGLVKNYSVTTDANGNFSFSIATTQASGYTDQGQIMTVNFVHTQDTIHIVGGQVPGLPGYFNGTSYFINNLYPNAVSNGNYMYYNSFNAN